MFGADLEAHHRLPFQPRSASPPSTRSASPSASPGCRSPWRVDAAAALPSSTATTTTTTATTPAAPAMASCAASASPRLPRSLSSTAAAAAAVVATAAKPPATSASSLDRAPVCALSAPSSRPRHGGTAKRASFSLPKQQQQQLVFPQLGALQPQRLQLQHQQQQQQQQQVLRQSLEQLSLGGGLPQGSCATASLSPAASPSASSTRRSATQQSKAASVLEVVPEMIAHVPAAFVAQQAPHVLRTVPASSTTTSAAAAPFADPLAPTSSSSQTSAGPPCIIFDIRGPSSYSRSHIKGALSASCSTMLQRRLAKGSLGVADLLNKTVRPLYKSLRDQATIVVYDQASDSWAADAQGSGGSGGGSGGVAGSGPGPSPSSLLPTFLAALQRETGREVNFLQGGFAAFQAAFPHLVSSSASAAPRSLVFKPTQRAPLSASKMVRPDDLFQSPTEVVPFLYLGCRRDAQNPDLLRQMGIRFVLNVTTDDNVQQQDASIVSKQIPVRDTWHQNLHLHFDEAFAFIEAARQAKRPIMVHCMAGISRSATIVIAYLMKKKHASLNDSYRIVKELRSTVSPNLDFMGQLLEYEKSLGIKSGTSLSEFLGEVDVAPQPFSPCGVAISTPGS